MSPQSCHYCNMLVSRDQDGRAVATHPAVAEPWTCPANPSGHLIAAKTAADVRITVMSGQEAGLQRLRQQAGETGEAVTEYAQLDGNGVFLVWDTDPDGEERFPLAERIRIARSYGGIIFRRRVIAVEAWTEVTEP